MLKQGLSTFIFILFFSLGLFLPLSTVSAFSVLSSHKYAWSDNVGYINFEHVTVSDGVLGGYAWSANKGFINFSPAQAGVLNDGTGNLSGSAWGEQLGYIDFNNVNINGATGKFSGTATGTLAGTITFNCAFCDVETDWRQTITPPPPTPPPAPSSGGGGGGRKLPSNINATSPSFPSTGTVPSFPNTGQAVSAPVSLIKLTKPINLKNKTEVKNLQRILNKALGWNLKVDGIYGKLTLSAVKAFQKANQLKVDGIIGPKTRAKLNLVI